MTDGWYFNVSTWAGYIIGGLTFAGCWIDAIAQWGFLLGVAFGWIPAAIIGIIAFFAATFLWPLLAVGVVLIALLIANGG